MLVINTLENVKSRLHFWTYATTENDNGSGSGEWTYSGAQEGQ